MSDDELPEGWSRVALSDLTERVQSVNPTAEPKREFGYVDISAIDRHRSVIRPSELRRFVGADAPSRARRPIRPGDVLFSNVRTNLRNVALVDSFLDAQICSTGFTVLRPTPAISPSFLLRWVLTDDFVDRISETQTGTHYPATSDAQVLAQAIVVPPLAEQKRIVETAEALLADVNAARDRLARVPLILKRFRQSVLAAACSGRLTEEWRDTHPKVVAATSIVESIRAVREKRKDVAGKLDDGEADLPDADLPVGWCWCRVADIATVCLGGTPSRKEPSYWGGLIPWVSSGEVANCRISATKERITNEGLLNSAAKVYPKGSVLIAMIGEGKTRGQSAILEIDACTNQNAAGLVFEPGTINPDYVWFWALGEYENTRDVGRGGNQPALNGRKVRALPVPLPPLAEQAEIVRRVEALFALADSIEARVKAATARADKLPQAILSKAFRGELVPTEAELALAEGRRYETAAEMLERVKAGANTNAIGKAAKNPRAKGKRGRA